MVKRSYIKYIACLALAGCAATKSAKLHFATNGIVAHRGAWKKNKLPENSIAALREAIRLGCAGSEFDVHMTSDDSLVINHDPTYNNYKIEQSTFAQVTEKPLSNGETLPTLRQYLISGMQNNTSTRLVIEIKPSAISKERGEKVAGKTLALVRELHAEKYAVYISFDYNVLKKLESLDATVQTQFLDGNKTAEELKQDGIDGADYHYSVFKKNPGWIDSMKQQKLVLNAWTVNDPADMDWLLQQKFNFITTNEPELLQERRAAMKQ